MSHPRCTPVEAMRLAERHIERYSARIREAEAVEGGHPHTNLPQCRMYLTIWLSIRDKGGRWDKLDLSERREIEDARASGELDE